MDKKKLCPHCGVDLVVEKEVFSRDKLFKGHNCKGKTHSGQNLGR